MRAMLLCLLAVPMVTAAELDVLLPAESDQITYVNVKRLATSKLFKDMLMKEITDKLKETQVPKWLKEAGVDPWKDIETISMMMVPPKQKKKGKDDELTDGSSFVVIRGKFDTDKLLAAADKAIKEAGDVISMTKEDDLRIVQIKPKNGNQFYITMADEKTLIGASTKELLHAAIKQADAKDAKPAVKSKLATLIGTLDDKAAFYQVMYFDGKEAAAGIGENPLFEDTELLKKQVSEIECYSLTARAGTDVTFEFSTGLTSPEAAAAFVETAKSMVEKGRLLVGLLAAGKTEFSAITNDLKKSMKVTVAGDIVKLSAKITGDAIGKGFGVEE